MKLKDYLKFNKISNIQFSKIIGISPISLSRYISGERFPEKKTFKNSQNYRGFSNCK